MRVNDDGTVSPSDVRIYCRHRLDRLRKRTVKSVQDNHEGVILITILRQFTKMKNMHKELTRTFKNGEGI